MLTVEMKNITKHFGNLVANQNVNLRVAKGEIHALVGENGAGKSTLMNILYGFHRPDDGHIFINGSEQKIENPAKAMALGIGMVHQHFMLIPPLTVTENIILGKEPTRIFNRIDTHRAAEEIKQISDLYHLNIEPNAKIESLSVGVQQRVEILKILYRNASILILDEPTAVLAPQEVEDLFKTLANLRLQGKTVILITHKLNEVISFSDTVTVMRRGRMVTEVQTKNTSQSELSQIMVGRAIEFTPHKSSVVSKNPILSLKNVSALNDRKLPVLRNVSLSVMSGEILGIAGVEGNGQTELIELVTGLRKPTNGTITIHDINIQNNFDALEIAHIPEDRHKRGLVLDLSIAENLILGRHCDSEFSGFFSLHRRRIDEHADTMIERYDIRPAKKDQIARGLSGGNQQKVVIARELSKDADVIVASQPTRGLDIGAIEYVHTSILAERNKGKAVLLVSSELSELLTLSDRIAVIFNGEIVTILNAQQTSERELGTYMTGAHRKAG